MSTLVLSHPSGTLHENGPGHPEQPDRLRAIEKVLADDLFKPLTRKDTPKGDPALFALAHPQNYIDLIDQSRPAEGRIMIDNDTSMNKHSWNTLLHSAGGASFAVDEIIKGTHKNAFLAMRPPGHHAEKTRACGFCIFNIAAIAAFHAQKAHGLERVAVIDFDVHHGNGTQDIFWDDKNLFYGSTHQMPLFPGTGAKDETGVGNIFNAPLAAGDGGEKFRQAYETVIFPALKNFKPDMIIMSAGFDAHRDDPLANLMLEEADFSWVTKQLLEIADKTCKGRSLSILEGGYNLTALAKSAGVHVKALMDAAS